MSNDILRKGTGGGATATLQEQKEKREKRKAEILAGPNGEGSAILSLPEDRSYLDRVDPKQISLAGDPKNPSRELTSEEKLTFLLAQKATWAMELEATVAHLRNQLAKKEEEIAKVTLENVQMRRVNQERERAELLKGIGVTPDTPIMARDGKLFFRGGLAPEDIPAWVEAQETKARVNEHSHDHDHDHPHA